MYQAIRRRSKWLGLAITIQRGLIDGSNNALQPISSLRALPEISSLYASRNVLESNP
jgi:hypothetical protein